MEQSQNFWGLNLTLIEWKVMALQGFDKGVNIYQKK